MIDGSTSGSTVLSHADAEALRGTAKWARFLAIVTFVFLGLYLLFWIFLGSKLASAGNTMRDAQMEQMRQLQEQMGGMEGVDTEAMMESTESMATGASVMAGVFGTVFVVLIIAIAVIPTVLLYQFGTRTLKALDGPLDSPTLTNGLNAHRRYYKFAGIMMIIALALMALALLFGGLGAMMM